METPKNILSWTLIAPTIIGNSTVMNGFAQAFSFYTNLIRLEFTIWICYAVNFLEPDFFLFNFLFQRNNYFVTANSYNRAVRSFKSSKKLIIMQKKKKKCIRNWKYRLVLFPIVVTIEARVSWIICSNNESNKIVDNNSVIDDWSGARRK